MTKPPKFSWQGLNMFEHVVFVRAHSLSSHFQWWFVSRKPCRLVIKSHNFVFLRLLPKISASLELAFIVNKRTDTWICNLYDTATSESGQFDNLLCKKKIDVRSSCVCPSISNGFRHIVKVVCRSTRRSPVDPQLLGQWRNSWSITGQTQEKMRSVVKCCVYAPARERAIKTVATFVRVHVFCASHKA